MTIALGVLAVATPMFATLAVDLTVGRLFLLSGLLALVTTVSARYMPRFWWAIVTALLSVAVGVALLMKAYYP